jgi:predicted enzyme related to lactoylglutathione lyase
MPQSNNDRTRFECSSPILCVSDMSASLRYCEEILGFKKADWGTNDFTSVSRDRAGIYLCQRGQGRPGTWVWLGLEDVERIYEEYKASGAKIRPGPLNFPWAYEMKVEDPDGHVLQFGSEPKEGQPFDEWHD